MQRFKQRVTRLEAEHRPSRVYAVQFADTDRVCIWAIDGAGSGAEMTVAAFFQQYPQGQITSVVHEALWRAV